MKRALALALGLACAATLGADASYYPAATLWAPALALPASPRALAMGEAGTALEGDLFSIEGNPAGLARMSGDLELSYQYGSLNTATGAYQEMAAIGTHMTLGTVAMSFNDLPLGKFEYRDEEGNLIGSHNFFDADGALAWADTFFDKKLSFGLSADATYESRGSGWVIVPEGSLGAGWHWDEQLNLAASVTRLNFNYGSVNPPTAASAGAAYTAKDGSYKVLADFDYPFFDLPALRGGVEWRPVPSFALRAGWRQHLNADAADIESGPTAGLSATIQHLTLDYAFVSYGPDASHRIAITVKFPERWIRTPPVVIQAEGGTVAAKALYDLGASLQAKGRLVDALVAFKQSQQADASQPQVQDRIESLSGQLEAQGSDNAKNKEVEAVFKRYVDAGLGFFKGGEFKKAISSFEIALELDKKNVEVVEKLKDAQSQLDGEVAKQLEAANTALQQGDLEATVAALHQALKLDPDSQAAKSRLAALKPKIQTEVKRLHRKGIDLYVDDHLDEAIAQWQAALDMDPSDPEKVGRDLEKAKKLKELRK